MALVDWSTGDLEILREVVRAYRSGALFNQSRHSSRRQLAAIQEVGIGVTAEAIPDDGTPGDVTKWTVTSDAFAAIDPTETIEAHDFTLTGLPTSTRVLLARIAHAEGTRWLTIPAAQTTKARFIHATLPSALTTAQTSKASCTVTKFYFGTDPGATVTLWNEDGIFEAANGATCYAIWDDVDDKYRIWQVEC